MSRSLLTDNVRSSLVESTRLSSLGLPGVYLEYLERRGREKPRILPFVKAYVAVTVNVYQLHSAALEEVKILKQAVTYTARAA